MHQTHTHHSLWHLVSFGADQCFNVLEVGACSSLFTIRTGPGINIKVHSANGRVPRRIILMFQFWLRRNITFELHTIEPLYLVFPICLDESMQYAIGDVI